jgi:hypothetical protein
METVVIDRYWKAPYKCKISVQQGVGYVKHINSKEEESISIGQLVTLEGDDEIWSLTGCTVTVEKA